jgi:hypothetical protein
VRWGLLEVVEGPDGGLYGADGMLRCRVLTFQALCGVFISGTRKVPRTKVGGRVGVECFFKRNVQRMEYLMSRGGDVDPDKQCLRPLA